MQRKDIFLGLITVVIWGLNFIAISVGLTTIPPLLLGTLRFLVVMFPAIFFLPRPPIDWRWLIALGLTINTGQFAFLFFGMKMGMPSGLASLVLQAQVFFTMIMATAVLSERWHWNHVAGLFLAAVGMFVIGFQHGDNMTILGFMLTVCASVSWAAGNVIMRRATLGVPPYSILSLVVWAGAVAILPLLVLSWIIEGPAAWAEAWSAFNLSSAASIIYLAYFATFGGYVIWGKLLARYPAGVVSPFALLVPVVGLSSSALVLDEKLSVLQVTGAFLVMVGLIVHIFGRKIIDLNR